MIDFTDPNALMHQGETIPINTPEKYEIAREAAMAVYFAAGVPWDVDADQQLEQRARNGLTAAQIVQYTLADRQARFPE